MRQRKSRLAAIATLLALPTVGCIGHEIDEECIKGRISERQAAAINEGPWRHLPTYNTSPDGKCSDCAEPGDRILSAKCADFIKRTL